MNQRGNHNFYNAVEANPIIAAVKNMDDVENCCRIEEIKVVFILFGDICSLEEIINKIKKAGKTAVVHVDLINGLSSKEIAVEYIKKNTAADGIISTKISLIKRRRRKGCIQCFDISCWIQWRSRISGSSRIRYGRTL